MESFLERAGGGAEKEKGGGVAVRSEKGVREWLQDRQREGGVKKKETEKEV